MAGLRTDNERTGGTRTDASFEKHADEMQIMTWQKATREHMTWQGWRITGRHLAHQIRGVTAILAWLGHYMIDEGVDQALRRVEVLRGSRSPERKETLGAWRRGKT